MLNPESVMLNLFQHLFRAGLVQHLTKSRTYQTLKRVQSDPLGLFTRPSGIIIQSIECPNTMSTTQTANNTCCVWAIRSSFCDSGTIR